MILRSDRVVLPDGIQPADLVIEDGRIVEVRPVGGVCDRDFSGLVLMPGAVDAHVHINEPGRTHWEGFHTATRAAIAGGTTSLVDMPLNSIPTTTNVDALHAKRAASVGKLHCDVGFWGGVVPGNVEDLEPLWREGVLGFKAFLVPSGVDEFEWVGASVLAEATPVLARLGAPLLAHCEVPGPIDAASGVWAGDPRAHATWLASRPPAAETEAIALLASMAELDPEIRLHVVHLATEQGLPVLIAARAAGARITAETCAHYLTFEAAEVPDGATEFKCAPPIRSAATREALWVALGTGELSFVTTDHSPSPPDLKCLDTGRFDQAWGGIASVELFRAVVWTGAAARGHDLCDLARWTSSAPAEFVGLGSTKGKLAAGFDADIVVFDPDAAWTVSASALQHRHALTPYDGRQLTGRVLATYLRGECVFDDGKFAAPQGQPLRRASS